MPLAGGRSHAWPFAVATATQFRRFKRSRLTGIGAPSPPSGSGHSAATEEPAQPVTPPPTSPHKTVWRGETPFFQSPGDRRERGKRKPRESLLCGFAVLPVVFFGGFSARGVSAAKINTPPPGGFTKFPMPIVRQHKNKKTPACPRSAAVRALRPCRAGVRRHFFLFCCGTPRARPQQAQ